MHISTHLMYIYATATIATGFWTTLERDYFRFFDYVKSFVLFAVGGTLIGLSIAFNQPTVDN